LQNIPIRTNLGRQIREAFVPAPGNVFVSADYSQFELRLAAVLAGEEGMLNDFNAGTDIHAKTAAVVYHVPLDEVTKEQRRRAKVVNFGVLYGMSQHGLAAAANMSYAEAQHFIDEYYRMRPNLKSYMEQTVKKAHDEGFVATLFGRRRPTPDVKSSNFVVRQAAERAAANMPIQGTEADLMKMAMIEVETKLHATSEPLGEQILQIHDSIMVECTRENADRVSRLLVETMENIYPELGVRLQVDVHTGDNSGEV
jgi:DNA polymerase-1